MMAKPQNIVLAGFMGTGKSTVGELIAQQLGWEVVDSDSLIAERFGMSIPDIFAKQGESIFRGYEAQIAQELALRQKLVIATGGGMLVNPDNLSQLQQTGLVVCLNATPEEIEARVGDGQGRPLAFNWRELLEKRREAYARIPHQVDTTGRDPQEISEEIIDLWQKFG